MASTGFVPPHVCWLAYLAAAAAVALCFSNPLGLLSMTPWCTGLSAIVMATCAIFAFSFAYSNTSIYDPAWCLLPIFVAVGWMCTASSAPSLRGCYSLGLLLVWYARYALWWPWEGWTVGIHTEDWRYKAVADKVGNGAVYWLLSLVSLHMTPSLLVFFGLGPLQRVWSRGWQHAAPMGPFDAVGALVALSAITANGVADSQLRRFREQATKSSGSALETKHCGQTCRIGLWAFSRHPNYCAEASFWLGLALAAHADDPQGFVSFGWAWGGSIALFVFFRISASLMDARSLKHRKNYSIVMKEVPAVVPIPATIDRWFDLLLVRSQQD